MKIPAHNSQAARVLAFTLVEVLIAVAIIGVVVTSLYMSISSGFRVMEGARENLRATQIMVERLETIRLYNWSSLSNVPPKFTNYYNHVNNSGFPYYGLITVAPYSGSESYANELQQVTVHLTWTTGGIVRTNSMSSLIAKKGIQNYVY